MPTAQVVRRDQSRGASRGNAVVTSDPHEAEPRANRSAPWFVSRPALVNRLLDTRDAPLAILVAPPGYGKTTLLCEWAEHDERTFLRLAAQDRRTYGTDLAATSIIAALGERGLVEPSTCSALMGLVPLGAADVLRAAMRCVRPKSAFVLVIDDAHDLPPALLHEIVEPLLSALPGRSAVALASRVEPPLPLGRLRSHGDLVEIRTADLEFTSAEAASLLRRAEVELDFEAVRALVRKTEGWPAALYLAGLSVRACPEVVADPGWLAGCDHLLSDFVRDEVLSVVPPELADFSMRTAVLEELSGPLCDHVLQQRGSAAALRKLADLTQLLVPLDPGHGRYRWHRLVGAALRAELGRTEPEFESQLQLRVSTWYEGQGVLDRAIDHAVAASDATVAGELLWTNLLEYVAGGRAAQVERWLGGFSPSAIAGSPRLALCAAHSALVLGKLDDAGRWSTAAASAIGRGRGDQNRSLETGLAVIDTLVARTGAHEMRAAATRVYDAEPVGSPWRPVVCLVRGVAEHLTGERDAAREVLEEGADLSAAAGPMVGALCLSVAAMIAIEDREWDLAADLTDRAVTAVEENQLTACPTSALVFAASAAARAQLDRADEAKRDLRRARDLLAALGEFIPWYGADARVLLAHASLSLADIVGARTLLAEASRLARRTPDATMFEHWFTDAWAYMDTLAESTLAGPSSLTIAELRILRFLPSHRSFREIGEQLGVSANTVKTQAHAVYRKLGAASRSEAVARATETGLIAQ